MPKTDIISHILKNRFYVRYGTLKILRGNDIGSAHFFENLDNLGVRNGQPRQGSAPFFCSGDSANARITWETSKPLEIGPTMRGRLG
jgi:hypothetical protein